MKTHSDPTNKKITEKNYKNKHEPSTITRLDTTQYSILYTIKKHQQTTQYHYELPNHYLLMHT